MSAPEDAVLAYWREHREQLRQSENQRAVLTNYVLVITAAISGFTGSVRKSNERGGVAPASADDPPLPPPRCANPGG